MQKGVTTTWSLPLLLVVDMLHIRLNRHIVIWFVDVAFECILRAVEVPQDSSDPLLRRLSYIIRPQPVDGHRTYREPIGLCTRLDASITIGKAERSHGGATETDRPVCAAHITSADVRLGIWVVFHHGFLILPVGYDIEPMRRTASFRWSTWLLKLPHAPGRKNVAHRHRPVQNMSRSSSFYSTIFRSWPSGWFHHRKSPKTEWATSYPYGHTPCEWHPLT